MIYLLFLCFLQKCCLFQASSEYDRARSLQVSDGISDVLSAQQCAESLETEDNTGSAECEVR